MVYLYERDQVPEAHHIAGLFLPDPAQLVYPLCIIVIGSLKAEIDVPVTFVLIYEVKEAEAGIKVYVPSRLRSGYEESKNLWRRNPYHLGCWNGYSCGRMHGALSLEQYSLVNHGFWCAYAEYFLSYGLSRVIGSAGSAMILSERLHSDPKYFPFCRPLYSPGKLALVLSHIRLP